jgi:hypothetical protein
MDMVEKLLTALVAHKQTNNIHSLNRKSASASQISIAEAASNPFRKQEVQHVKEFPEFLLPLLTP